MPDIRSQIADGIDAVEAAYEFFLAYAAQGITKEGQSGPIAKQLRGHLDKMDEAVSGLGGLLRALDEAEGPGVAASGRFRAVIEDDAENAGAILSMVRSQKSISSQLIDNLNASVHIRTLLTDLFLLDEALKLGVDQNTVPETSGTPT